MKILTKGIRWLAACGAVVAISLPVSVLAASDPGKVCGAPLTPSAAFERKALVNDAADDIVAGRLQVALDRIATTFEQSLPPGEAATPGPAAFLRQLRAPTSRWSALWEVAVDDDTANPILFERDPTERPVIIPCRPLPIATKYHDMVSIARFLNTAIAALEAPGKQAQWIALKQRATDHEDLIRNGLPMWPWELWLNGKRLGSSDADALFDTQFVFMRPSVGVEINTRSRERANLEGSLMLEPIGFVRYVDGSRFRQWWGASAVVTASTGQGMGYGALVRYGRYSAGLTLHHSDVPGVSNDVHFLVGMDLYDLIEKTRGELPAVRAGIRRSAVDLLLGPP
jgi:hypothetical protein